MAKKLATNFQQAIHDTLVADGYKIIKILKDGLAAYIFYTTPTGTQILVNMDEYGKCVAYSCVKRKMPKITRVDQASGERKLNY